MIFTNTEISIAHYCKQRYCYHDVNNHPKRAKITRVFEIKQGGGACEEYNYTYDYNIKIEKTNAEQWIEKHRYD